MIFLESPPSSPIILHHISVVVHLPQGYLSTYKRKVSVNKWLRGYGYKSKVRVQWVYKGIDSDN